MVPPISIIFFEVSFTSFNHFAIFTPKALYVFLGFRHRYLIVSDATVNVIVYSITPSLLV